MRAKLRAHVWQAHATIVAQRIVAAVTIAGTVRYGFPAILVGLGVFAFIGLAMPEPDSDLDKHTRRK